MTHFDLIESQREARSSPCASQLFQLWEKVCKLYDRGLIGQYDLDEMKGVILPKLKALCAMQCQVEDSFNASSAA